VTTVTLAAAIELFNGRRGNFLRPTGYFLQVAAAVATSDLLMVVPSGVFV
jgi:hypothetical protein